MNTENAKPTVMDKNRSDNKKDDAKGLTVTPEVGTPEKEPERELSVNETLARNASGETSNAGQGFIEHTVRTMGPDGVVHEKKHGPMPVGEWAEYSAKNGL